MINKMALYTVTRQKYPPPAIFAKIPAFLLNIIYYNNNIYT